MLLGGFQGKGLDALGMVTAQTPFPPLICLILIPFFRPSMSKRKDIPGIITYTRHRWDCFVLSYNYYHYSHYFHQYYASAYLLPLHLKMSFFRFHSIPCM